MNDPYYGGRSAFDGKQFALQANDSTSLVDRYFSIAHPIPITKQAYLALAPDAQSKIKDGPFVCACTFQKGTTKRCDANAQDVRLLCIDLDTPDDGAGYVRDFWENPETIGEALQPFDFVAHETATCSPENPRIRIIVFADHLPLTSHRGAVLHVMDMLGLPDDFKGRRESLVLSQPMYRPPLFKEAKDSPVLASRTNGVYFQTADLPEPDDDDEGLAPRRYEFTYDGDMDSLELTHLPLPDVTPTMLREAIFKIDPDCGYRTWTYVASALRHQFPDPGDASEAFALFNEWSAKGDKYKGDHATYKKWCSFRPFCNGKTPITLRSLFKFAIDAGWKSQKLASEVEKSIETWMQETSDSGVLMAEAPQRIAQMPFKNAIVEEALYLALQRRIKELTGDKIEKSTIKKQVRDSRFLARKEEMSAFVDKWLRGWCYVASSNTFRNVNTGRELSPASFNNMFASNLMPSPDADTDEDLAKTGRPIVLPVDHALNVVQIKKVYGVTYDPRHGGEEPYFLYCGEEYVNEYLLSSLPAEDPERSEEAGRLFDKLLNTLIGCPEEAHMVKLYYAHNVQHTGEKIRWAPMFQSAEGAGKGVLGMVMEAAIGQRNVKVVTSAVLNSDFNGFAAGSAFCIVDEAKAPGTSKMSFMDKMKPLITNDRISVNEKHEKMVVVLNVTNFMVCTNRHDALYIEESDRRYMPIRSPLQTKDQVTEVTETGFFQEIVEFLTSYPGAMRHYLLNVEIPKSFPVNGPAPVTAYRQEMVASSKNRLQEAIEDQIDGDNPLIAPDIVHLVELNSAVELEARNNYKPTHFLAALDYIPYDNLKRFDIEGVKTQIYVHRTRFAEGFGDPDEILRERFRKYIDEML